MGIWKSKDPPLIISGNEIKGNLLIIEIYVPLLCLGHTDEEQLFLYNWHPCDTQGKNISALALWLKLFKYESFANHILLFILLLIFTQIT